MTGIEFFLTFAVGFWQAHLPLLAVIAAIAIIGGGFADLAWRLLRDEPLTAEDRAAIEWAQQLGGPPPELHHERVLLPVGMGDHTWAPQHRKTSRHGAGVTPTGQPGRGGDHKPAGTRDGATGSTAAGTGTGLESPAATQTPAPAPTGIGDGGGRPGVAHAPAGDVIQPVTPSTPGPDLRPEDAPGPGSEPDQAPACEATGPAPDLPEAVTAAFGPLRATLAAIGQQETDAQRWPDLMPGQGYSDDTGTFTAICAEVP